MTINAHRFSSHAGNFTLEWRDPVAPSVPGPEDRYGQHASGRRCSYCGSMHPSDLAEALGYGAQAHWADWKYGWPHKLYVEGVRNPFAGMPEVVMTATAREGEEGAEQYRDGFDENTGLPRMRWRRIKVEPSRDTLHSKFYTEHLQDATPEERLVIERAMGISFTFDDKGGVSWKAFSEPVQP